MSCEHNAERSKIIPNVVIDLGSRNPLTWRSVGRVVFLHTQAVLNSSFLLKITSSETE